MTQLKGELKREMQAPGIHRPIIVSLDAETGRLGVREKGGHKTFWISISTVYALAIRASEEK